MLDTLERCPSHKKSELQVRLLMSDPTHSFLDCLRVTPLRFQFQHKVSGSSNEIKVTSSVIQNRKNKKLLILQKPDYILNPLPLDLANLLMHREESPKEEIARKVKHPATAVSSQGAAHQQVQKQQVRYQAEHCSLLVPLLVVVHHFLVRTTQTLFTWSPPTQNLITFHLKENLLLQDKQQSHQNKQQSY